MVDEVEEEGHDKKLGRNCIDVISTREARQDSDFIR